MSRERVEAATAEPAEPWRSFLRDLDAALKGSVELRCLGGFVVSQHYGIGRETADIDFLAATMQSRKMTLKPSPGSGPRSIAGTVSTCNASPLQRLRQTTPTDWPVCFPRRPGSG